MKKIDYGDLIGKRSGKLVVQDYLGLQNIGKGKRASLYRCLCDCGNEVIVPRSQLVSHHKVSCGGCRSIMRETAGYRYYCRNGDYFEFGDQDYELVAAHAWYMNRGGYPCTKVDGTIKLLTHLIFDIDDDTRIDHIDGNPRNNHRDNLRIATDHQNSGNVALKNTNTTGFKGVSFFSQREKYRATIRTHGKQKHLGYFASPIEAARAYDTAARFLFGEFACVNFPLPGEQGCSRNRPIEPATTA